MGTPLPPNEIGTTCVNCFGTGEPHGFAPTPKVIIATFTGFTPNEAWDGSQDQLLLTPQYLVQEASPCVWSLVAGPTKWFLNWTGTITVFSIIQDGGIIEYFRGDLSTKCELVIPNQQDPGQFVYCTGGVVTLSWNPGDLE